MDLPETKVRLFGSRVTEDDLKQVPLPLRKHSVAATPLMKNLLVCSGWVLHKVADTLSMAHYTVPSPILWSVPHGAARRGKHWKRHNRETGLDLWPVICTIKKIRELEKLSSQDSFLFSFSWPLDCNGVWSKTAWRHTNDQAPSTLDKCRRKELYAHTFVWAHGKPAMWTLLWTLSAPWKQYWTGHIICPAATEPKPLLLGPGLRPAES